MFVAASLLGFQTLPSFFSSYLTPLLYRTTLRETRRPLRLRVMLDLYPLFLCFLKSLLPLSSATASCPLPPHFSPHAPPSISPDSHWKSAATHAPSSAFHTESRIHTLDSSASSFPLLACTPPSSNKNCPYLRRTRESSHAASAPASPNSSECC